MVSKAVTLKCELCGKEIVGMSEGHAERLLRVHRYTKHLQQKELRKEDEEMLTLLKSMPRDVVNSLLDEDKRKLIVAVLEGKVKTFKYLNDKPSWQEILDLAEKMGYSKSELISEVLADWFDEAKNFKR
jgi:hypothetical protein